MSIWWKIFEKNFFAFSKQFYHECVPFKTKNSTKKYFNERNWNFMRFIPTKKERKKLRNHFKNFQYTCDIFPYNFRLSSFWKWKHVLPSISWKWDFYDIRNEKDEWANRQHKIASVFTDDSHIFIEERSSFMEDYWPDVQS